MVARGYLRFAGHAGGDRRICGCVTVTVEGGGYIRELWLGVYPSHGCSGSLHCLWSMMAEGGPVLQERTKEVVVGTEFPSLLHLRHRHPVRSKVIGRTGSRFRIEDFSKDNSKAPYFELKGRKS